jgi:hypothetical protein
MRLDQQQAVVHGGLTIESGAQQTVRIAHSGRLVRVDLPLCNGIKGAQVALKVQTESRTRRSTVAKLTFAHSYADCLWYTFHLRPSLSVQRNEKILLTTYHLRGAAPLWGWSVGKKDAYRGGAGSWERHAVNDFAFRTYVVTS